MYFVICCTINQALFTAVNTDSVLTPAHPLLPNVQVGVIPIGKVRRRADVESKSRRIY